MSQYEERLAYWEAKVYDQATIIALDKDIQTWTQWIKYLQYLADRAKKNRSTINTCNLDCLESSLHAEVKLGIKRTTTAWSLGRELEQLRARDLRNDQRILHV